MTQTQTQPPRVIWSVCQTHKIAENYVHDVIDQAVGHGVSGIELVSMAIDDYLMYRDTPSLASAVDARRVEDERAMLTRITDHAHAKGLKIGHWHHEIWGPRNLLELMPQLRADDGLVDLDQPALYTFVTGKIAEFFDLFPGVDELVLTMTETHIPVFRRPFCEIPIAERVRRLLRAILDATEPRGKQLVIRPFSAIRSDELHVREAVESLNARHVSMMYKTEPFDWNPFLPNEPLIGSIPGYEARAETDAGAEYYGQGVFPCLYTEHLAARLGAARERGATTAVIRIDRGSNHTSLGTPINEGNVIAATRWWLDPSRPIRAHLADWWRDRRGRPEAVLPVLEQTFDVIKASLYLDGQSLSHQAFPSLDRAKHIQVFHLLEEDVPLTHMSRLWSTFSDRRTPTHEQALAEKWVAVELSRSLLAQYDQLCGNGDDPIRDALARLEYLAEACLQLCRLAIAHVREMWPLPEGLTASFEEEARAMISLADRIEQKFGSEFFRRMPEQMRSHAVGLIAEQAAEIPLRERIEVDPLLVDYILCGFASEAHRLSKLLHSGATSRIDTRWYRVTGEGEELGVGYLLTGPADTPLQLEVERLGQGTAAPGVVRINGCNHPLPGDTTVGPIHHRFHVPATTDGQVAVTLWCTTPTPLTLATITLRRAPAKVVGREGA